MPKAHEEGGFRFNFYSNDHLPMHVHAKKGGTQCIFLLGEIRETISEEDETVIEVVTAPSIRENRGMSPADVRRAFEIVVSKQTKMIAKWQEHLGSNQEELT